MKLVAFDRKVGCLILIVLASALLFFVPATPASAAACGDVMADGTWKGVVGYYNGANQRTPNSCGGTGTFGLLYQCAEYTDRFYSSLGMKSSAWHGNANTYMANARSWELVAYNNSGTIAPKVNDILVFDEGVYGHVAIITGITSINASQYRVDFVEQNWSDTGAASLTMAFNAGSGTYTIQNRDSYSVIGWLRIPYSAAFKAQDPANVTTIHPGETHTFVVYYTNTMVPPATTLLNKFGALDWKNDAPDASHVLTIGNNYHDNDGLPKFNYIELHSVNSAGLPTPSFLYPGDDIWISNDKIRVVAQSAANVGNTQNAKFEFQGKVPATTAPGTYKIYFRPYHATGGYLDNTVRYFTLNVEAGSSYSVGQCALSNIATLFVNAHSGNEALLGAPTSCVQDANSGFGSAGYYQKFEKGSIQVYSNNAYIVYGTFYQAWGAQSYATWAGFPTSNRYACLSGECQDFEGGYMSRAMIYPHFRRG